MQLLKEQVAQVLLLLLAAGQLFKAAVVLDLRRHFKHQLVPGHPVPLQNNAFDISLAECAQADDPLEIARDVQHLLQVVPAIEGATDHPIHPPVGAGEQGDKFLQQFEAVDRFQKEILQVFHDAYRGPFQFQQCFFQIGDVARIAQLESVPHIGNKRHRGKDGIVEVDFQHRHVLVNILFRKIEHGGAPAAPLADDHGGHEFPCLPGVKIGFHRFQFRIAPHQEAAVAQRFQLEQLLVDVGQSGQLQLGAVQQIVDLLLGVPGRSGQAGDLAETPVVVSDVADSLFDISPDNGNRALDIQPGLVAIMLNLFPRLGAGQLEVELQQALAFQQVFDLDDEFIGEIEQMGADIPAVVMETVHKTADLAAGPFQPLPHHPVGFFGVDLIGLQAVERRLQVKLYNLVEFGNILQDPLDLFPGLAQVGLQLGAEIDPGAPLQQFFDRHIFDLRSRGQMRQIAFLKHQLFFRQRPHRSFDLMQEQLGDAFHRVAQKRFHHCRQEVLAQLFQELAVFADNFPPEALRLFFGDGLKCFQ